MVFYRIIKDYHGGSDWKTIGLLRILDVELSVIQYEDKGISWRYLVVIYRIIKDYPGGTKW